MSYIVTARKWRPQLFREVIGQSHVTDTLQKAILSGKVGHAYLFSGPRGVGKTTVARIFAKALNCVEGPAAEPCNKCDICKSIQSFSSMDILELDGASHNSVEDVRDLIENIGYHSSQCRYKMYIIDEVHMLSNNAFNALLKTLEEPPPNVIFVLATTEPQKLPPTILSRCQRYDFRRLSVENISEKMRMITRAENIEIDDDSVMLIARRATGAMRDAESILEQLKASRGNKITVEDVNAVLGIADRDVFFDIIDCCIAKNISGTIAAFNRYFDAGGDLREFIEGMLGHLRDMLYARLEGGFERVLLPEDLKKRLSHQASSFEYGDIVRMTGYITDAESSLAYAVMPVLRLEAALAKMSLMDSTVQLKELFEMLGGKEAAGRIHEAKIQANVAPVVNQDYPEYEEVPEYDTYQPSYEPVKAAPVKTVQPEDNKEDDTACLDIPPETGAIRKAWDEITRRVGSQKPSSAPSLAVAVVEKFSNGKLSLSFNSDFHLKIVQGDLDVIGEIIGALLKTKIKLDLYVKTAPAEHKSKGELSDLVSREPIIGTIMDLFDGEIRTGGKNNG